MPGRGPCGNKANCKPAGTKTTGPPTAQRRCQSPTQPKGARFCLFLDSPPPGIYPVPTRCPPSSQGTQWYTVRQCPEPLLCFLITFRGKPQPTQMVRYTATSLPTDSDDWSVLSLSSCWQWNVSPERTAQGRHLRSEKIDGCAHAMCWTGLHFLSIATPTFAFRVYIKLFL